MCSPPYCLQVGILEQIKLNTISFYLNFSNKKIIFIYLFVCKEANLNSRDEIFYDRDLIRIWLLVRDVGGKLYNVAVSSSSSSWHIRVSSRGFKQNYVPVRARAHIYISKYREGRWEMLGRKTCRRFDAAGGQNMTSADVLCWSRR